MSARSPKKRKASSTSSLSLTLSERESSSTRKVKFEFDATSPADNPIVISFPSGVPVSLTTTGAGNAQRSSGVDIPQFQWQKLSAKSSLGRKVVGRDKHCVYSSSASGLAYDDRHTKLCVGIYHKRTGIVKIREAAVKGTVFALQQLVPAYLEKNANHENNNAAGGTLTYSTQVYDDFGSAKKRRAIKSQAANRVDINHVVGAGTGSAIVDKILKGESMSESNRKAIAETSTTATDPDSSNPINNNNKAVDAAHEAARRNFLPVYDEKAAKPYQVYSARNIAGDAAWSKVYNKVHGCSFKDDFIAEIVQSIDSKDWMPSVLTVVQGITSPEKSDTKDRLTSAILLNWLVRFYKFNHTRRSIPAPDENKAFFFGSPTEVAVRWITLFTTAIPGKDGKSSHVMSKQDKDKCVVHALVLYMLSQGSKMTIGDLKPIAKDLQVQVNDCAQMLRMAGCQIVKKGTTISAILKTPLTFPPPRRAAKRGS